MRENEFSFARREESRIFTRFPNCSLTTALLSFGTQKHFVTNVNHPDSTKRYQLNELLWKYGKNREIINRLLTEAPLYPRGPLLPL